MHRRVGAPSHRAEGGGAGCEVDDEQDPVGDDHHEGQLRREEAAAPVCPGACVGGHGTG